MVNPRFAYCELVRGTALAHAMLLPENVGVVRLLLERGANVIGSRQCVLKCTGLAGKMTYASPLAACCMMAKYGARDDDGAPHLPILRELATQLQGSSPVVVSEVMHALERCSHDLAVTELMKAVGIKFELKLLLHVAQVLSRNGSWIGGKLVGGMELAEALLYAWDFPTQYRALLLHPHRGEVGLGSEKLSLRFAASVAEYISCIRALAAEKYVF